MATYIFDFDNTLFDTKKMVLKMFLILKQIGIQEKEITETFYKSKDINDNYVLNKNLNLLVKKSNLNKIDFLKKWRKVNFKKFLFKNSVKILNKLKKNNEIILLTKGNFNFQKEKIKRSKLNIIFKEKNIYIVKKKKENLIKKLKLEGEVYFINDKLEENLKIKELFPSFVIKNSIKKLSNYR